MNPVNYLLDTHVFLWMLSQPDRLVNTARDVIQNPDHWVFVSAISGMEIAIKKSLGKLDAPEDLEHEIEQRGIQHLPLHFRHGATMARLPFHHQDPFDRMLVAQALSEQLILITHDKKLAPYDAEILWT